MATAAVDRVQMSEAEWEARQELAACYRVFAMLGWSEMIYNHITLKIPGEDGAFLINPFGLHFSEVMPPKMKNSANTNTRRSGAS